MKTPRRRAREFTVQALYQSALTDAPAAETAENIRESSDFKKPTANCLPHSLQAAELAAMPEPPYPVIINEAIEVTKTFGGTDGHKFVNGILDKLAAQLRPNDPKRG